MLQEKLLPKGAVVKIGGVLTRLEQDIKFFTNDMKDVDINQEIYAISSSKNMTHWRNLVKIKARIRNGEEIHTVTSKFQKHIETMRDIEYMITLPGNEWRIIEDIHIHGVLFPKYRMVLARKANVPWPKKDMKYLKILELIFLNWARCIRRR